MGNYINVRFNTSDGFSCLGHNCSISDTSQEFVYSINTFNGQSPYLVWMCPRVDREKQVCVGKIIFCFWKYQSLFVFCIVLCTIFYSSDCESSSLFLCVSRLAILMLSLFSSSASSARCTQCSLFFLQPFISGEQVSNIRDTAWGQQRQRGKHEAGTKSVMNWGRKSGN